MSMLLIGLHDFADRPNGGTKAKHRFGDDVR
jgi:hypothetical protein